MQPQQSSSNNKIIAVFIVIVLLGIGYYYFFIRNVDDVSLDIGSLEIFNNVTPGGGEASAEILALLQQINRLSIDPKFFDRPDYRSLRDYPIVIPPQNVGRDNPFAPFFRSSTSRSTTTSSVVLSPVPRN